MDGEAWRAAVHGVAKSRTRLSDWTELNWIHGRAWDSKSRALGSDPAHAPVISPWMRQPAGVGLTVARARQLRTGETEGAALRAGAWDETHPCGDDTHEAWRRGKRKARWWGLWSLKLRRVVSQGPRMPSEPFRTHAGVRLLWAQAAMQRQRGRKLEAETAERGAQETVRPMENKDRRHGWGSCVVIHRARAPPLRRGWLCILRSQHNMHYEAGWLSVGTGRFSMFAFLEKHPKITQKKRTWRSTTPRICCGYLSVLNEYSGLYITGISHFSLLFS